MDEKRRYLRVPNTVTIQYKTPQGWNNLGETIDISQGGFGLKLNSHINSNRIIRCRTSDETIHAKGRIAWVNQDKCGIEFQEIDPQSRNRLSKLIVSKDIFLQYLLDSLQITDATLTHVFKTEISSTLKLINQLLDSRDEQTQNKVFDLFDEIVEKIERAIPSSFDRLKIKNLKKAIRELVGPWVYQSLIIKRGYEKPRGYPGDYATIESIYDGQIISPEEGQIFDRYFFKNPYARAVKNRKDKMREILLHLISNWNRNLRVLNIACGSCREIREIIPSLQTHQYSLDFLLSDQDEEALAFAKKTILEMNPSKNLNFNFYQENILSFIQNPEEHIKKLGVHNIIYSIGLVDYLPDRVLISLLKFLFQILDKDGVLILTHKDIDQYEPRSINWYCDWNFVSRNQIQFLSLIKKASPYPVVMQVEREKEQIIFFVSINKS